MSGLVLVAALLLDRWLGELRRWHPLVGYGHLVSRVEAVLYKDSASPAQQLLRGGLGWILLVVAPVLLLSALLALLPTAAAAVISVLILYFAIGLRSLGEHARAVAKPLRRGDLAQARRQLAMIVSRDTAQLEAPAITRATMESVLENGSDAVIAPLFWFVVAGAPGVLAQRLINTLDARWGYRSSRFLYFGRLAARADDLINWLPARLTALAYALVGRWRPALQCWRQQGGLTASPNAGVVMAAGAGALEVQLGGPATYHGQQEWRPPLGCGRIAQVSTAGDDIDRSVALLERASWLLAILWLVLATVSATTATTSVATPTSSASAAPSATIASASLPALSSNPGDWW
ncbi:cobalamin biosynthesis protein CobD [Pseudomaricurvus alcaniphilus]|uniref:adenosylcobinamide-phosphate synthase CbiB n=1 Tax=Pseudomaricurvus alcaniphilus TaxID=1166482 RepID=UPI00140C25F8|nr:cobalamin biosynthesis protein CobD [Pseudomaricurvus alcaniphilus]